MVKRQSYVPQNAIQRTVVIIRGFGTDKSVPYEKNQHFPIQRTGTKPLPRWNAWMHSFVFFIPHFPFSCNGFEPLFAFSATPQYPRLSHPTSSLFTITYYFPKIPDVHSFFVFHQTLSFASFGKAGFFLIRRYTVIPWIAFSYRKVFSSSHAPVL